LTYKSDVPSELIKDLTFDTSERVLVKHSNGNVNYIQGSPNKRALYGYDANNNNLIQLDVSNYTINRDTGALELVDLKSLGFKYYNSTIFTNPDHGKNNIFEVAG
jgi:6-phosphogluconolactonase (cycloisomerase 2 family)